MFRVCGWSQAETARQLGLTRGGVNGIITGDTIPSVATVKLFKLLLMTEKPDVLKPSSFPMRDTPVLPSWGTQLIHELQRVDHTKRENIVASFLDILAHIPKSIEKRTRR